MALDFDAIGLALRSFAARSGYFEQVDGHETENPPGAGLTAATWLQRIATGPGGGLSTTNAAVTVAIRIYAGANMEPPDSIDPMMSAAANALLSEIIGDFDLSTGTPDGLPPGTVRNVDIEGQIARPEAVAGWLPTGDGGLQRIITITAVVIVNDAWAHG